MDTTMAERPTNSRQRTPEDCARESARIAADVDAFLARGGVIEKLGITPIRTNSSYLITISLEKD